jgi:dGTPase
MDLSDDIAFGVHDLEDAIAVGLLRREEFRSGVPAEACTEYLELLSERYGETYDDLVQMLFSDGWDRKHAISRLVGYFVQHCRIGTRETLDEPLIRFRAEMLDEARAFLDALTTLVRNQVIFSAEVQHLEFKGQQMVVAVFEALRSEPQRFLPYDTRAAFDRSGGAARVICDHVAGMTDAFLLRTYERLYSPRMGSVFDKL